VQFAQIPKRHYASSSARSIIWLGLMERRAAGRSCAVFPTLGLYALFIWMLDLDVWTPALPKLNIWQQELDK